MKPPLVALFVALVLSGCGLLAYAGAQIFGPAVWAIAGGLVCLLVATALFGWRAVLVVLAEGHRGLSGE